MGNCCAKEEDRLDDLDSNDTVPQKMRRELDTNATVDTEFADIED